jgi:energy-coupling factor transporter ATP-binding protein EcfA2
MNFRELQLAPDSRGVLVGQTGSGKSTLAEYLLKSLRYVAAIDPKGMLKFRGYTRYTTLKAVTGSRDERVIYAPRAEELRDPRYIGGFFEWVYRRKNTFCYVDEVYAVTDRDEMPDYYHALLTRGRERNSGVLSASQRPIRIPNVIMSESEFWYVFRLSMPADRKKVEDTIALDSDAIAGLQKREFFFARADLDFKAGPLKLSLPSAKQAEKSYQTEARA